MSNAHSPIIVFIIAARVFVKPDVDRRQLGLYLDRWNRSRAINYFVTVVINSIIWSVVTDLNSVAKFQRESIDILLTRLYPVL